jgi:hypothetical protein
MKTEHPHLQLVPPPAVTLHTSSAPWWEAPEFRAVAEVRRALIGAAVPSVPARTAEESARQAVFWALFEVEHLMARYVKLIESGEDVCIRSSVYKHEERRVEIGLRIVEHADATIRLPGGGAT